MAGRRFNFGDEDEYIPTRFSPRVARNFSFEENDERFNEPEIGRGYQPREQTDPYDDIITRYKGVLGEEQPALKRYRESMQSMPRRQDYDLGKWGKFGAALAGFGAGYRDPMEGVKVATTLREQPYRQAVGDYEANLENLGQEVEFEAKDRATKMKGLDLELEGYQNRQKNKRENLVAQSQIDRRSAQTLMDARRMGLDESKFNLDYANTLDDNEREDYLAQSLANYRAGTLATGEYNAQTSRGQLGVAQGNLGVNRDRLNLDKDKFDVGNQQWQFGHTQREVEERGRNLRDANNNQSVSWLTPDAQNDAQDSAAREIYTKFPAYRDFFDVNDKGYISLKSDLPNEVLNSTEFKKVEAEIRGRAQKILNQRRGGGPRFEEVK